MLLASAEVSIRGGRPRRRRVYVRPALLGSPRRLVFFARLPRRGVGVLTFGR